MLTAFCAALMLFLLAKRDGEDEIFSNLGSILVSLSIFVLLSFCDAIALVSLRAITCEEFLFRKGRLGSQPAVTLSVKSKSKRLNKLLSLKELHYTLTLIKCKLSASVSIF